MQLRSLALAALAAASFQAHADTVALWDFNSFSCTANCEPPKATQTANGGQLSVLGVTISSVAGSGTGSAMNTTNYPAPNTASGTRGVQFMIDTTGYTDLVLTFAQRNSNTGSAWTTLQYTTDGTSWLDATNFFMPSASAATFVNGLTFDFTNTAGVNNNESFGIRFVAIFAPGTSNYAPTLNGQTYGTGGTVRYDNVLLSGDAIPDLPEVPSIPEPQTYALMFAGLTAIGLLARRRRAN